MQKEVRTAVYDAALQLEAYRLTGVVQPFPNHFHEHYVFGLVEHGQRQLSCKNRAYTLCAGDVLLLEPGDSHGCAQCDGGTLDYRGLNLPQATMRARTAELTGASTLPGFSQPVIRDEELAGALRTLHERVMRGDADFGKEEALLFFLSALLRRYGQPVGAAVPECPQAVERACAFMQAHFREKVSLDAICRCAGLSKSTLLRAFTKTMGISPYRYLEALRINEAKALLGKGVQPLDAAMQTGFSDQSHFTNYFRSFIGLAPGAYREIFLEKETDKNGLSE